MLSGNDNTYGSDHWSWQVNYNASSSDTWLWNQMVTGTDGSYSYFDYSVDTATTSATLTPPTTRHLWYTGTSGTMAEMYDTLASNGNISQITWDISHSDSLLVSTSLIVSSSYANEPIQYNNVIVGYAFASDIQFTAGKGNFTYFTTPNVFYTSQSCGNANHASWSVTAETSNMKYGSSFAKTCHRFPTFCVWVQSFNH